LFCAQVVNKNFILEEHVELRNVCSIKQQSKHWGPETIVKLRRITELVQL